MIPMRLLKTILLATTQMNTMMLKILPKAIIPQSLLRREPNQKKRVSQREKSKEGSKSASKSRPSKAHEEGVLDFESRPCNHDKWRKYYKYSRRGYTTTEEPERSPVTETEGQTTEPTIPRVILTR